MDLQVFPVGQRIYKFVARVFLTFFDKIFYTKQPVKCLDSNKKSPVIEGLVFDLIFDFYKCSKHLLCNAGISRFCLLVDFHFSIKCNYFEVTRLKFTFKTTQNILYICFPALERFKVFLNFLSLKDLMRNFDIKLYTFCYEVVDEL